jgi:5,10-methylenetetrahydromethanopterin reductase
VTIGRDAKDMAARIENIKVGAKVVGREIGKDFNTSLLTAGCVLRPGEKLTADRVVNETGSWVTCELHFFYEIWKKLGEKDELIPSYFANVWDDYLKRVKSFSLPEEARFRQIHDGHCTYMQPEERRFVTPEAIRASCVIGTPEEIVEQLRALEKSGIKELNLLPAADYQKNVWRDFAEMVIPAFR